jgi:hypothetical protein
MLTWKRDVGYNEQGQVVAWINPDYKNLVVKVEVQGDGYFISNTVVPPNSAGIVAAKQIAAITYRIIRNQPDKDAAQAAIRTYTRLKGGDWWEDHPEKSC